MDGSPVSRMGEVGEPVDGPGEAKLIVTPGEQERLKGRAVYFLRTLPNEKACCVQALR